MHKIFKNTRYDDSQNPWAGYTNREDPIVMQYKYDKYLDNERKYENYLEQMGSWLFGKNCVNDEEILNSFARIVVFMLFVYLMIKWIGNDESIKPRQEGGQYFYGGGHPRQIHFDDNRLYYGSSPRFSSRTVASCGQGGALDPW